MAYRQYGPQGSPGYNPYSKYPDIAGLVQQFMQNMMMMKQMKQQEEQQVWQREMKGKQMEVQKIGANIQLQEASRKRRGEELQAKEKFKFIEDIDKAVEAGTISEKDAFSLKMTGRLPTGKAPPKPTTFEQKKAYWDQRLATKEATQEQYDEAVWGVKRKPTPEETIKKGANVRQSNTTWLKDVYKNVDEGTVLKEAKKAKARPVVSGIKFDMPYDYNLAILNQQDRVETPEDLDVIAKYEAMYRVFQERLMGQGINSFKKFMTAEETRDLREDPNFNKGQIKRWYDIYRKY